MQYRRSDFDIVFGIDVYIFLPLLFIPRRNYGFFDIVAKWLYIMWCHVSFRKYPKKKSNLPWPNQSCCFQQMPPPSPHAHMCLGVWSVLDRPIWRISRAGGNYSVCARQLPCCYGQLLRLKTTKPLRMLFCNNALVFSFFLLLLLFFCVRNAAACTLPASITSSAGYVTSGCAGTIAQSACSLSCDTSGGYLGSLVATCSAPGEFSVTGTCDRMAFEANCFLSLLRSSLSFFYIKN